MGMVTDTLINNKATEFVFRCFFYSFFYNSFTIIPYLCDEF